MPYNYEEDRIYRWFEYKGVRYPEGTEVKLKDDVFSKTPYSYHKGQKFIFSYRSKAYPNILYFKIFEETLKGRNLHISIDDVNLIDRITGPVDIEKQKLSYRSKAQIASDNFDNGKRPDIFNGCCWYLIFMFLALFTKGAIFALIIITIFFIIYLIDKFA